jgi:hypothetical protein
VNGSDKIRPARASGRSVEPLTWESGLAFSPSYSSCGVDRDTDSKASDGVFGVAFLSTEGTGAYTDVSYNSAEELDQEWHVGLARVLGHVMAHELGHLLLGSNAHSRQGIMCPRWHGDELHLASKGSLLCSEEQARFMRERLAH